MLDLEAIWLCRPNGYHFVPVGQSANVDRQICNLKVNNLIEWSFISWHCISIHWKLHVLFDAAVYEIKCMFLTKVHTYSLFVFIQKYHNI